ncbi:MAG: glycoside hydrolase family 78 protein [Tannerellaceae bacterium]|jgi:alpha-L-rhamnosidase|nr:glycoside hydrolase family 78 protein [Tannerellaceae bacterium]
MKPIHLLLILWLSGLLPSCKGEDMQIVNLRCEYLAEPPAIENPKPLLSWELLSPLRGKSQTAYRILVATSPALLKEGEADCWDSGLRQTSRSVQIAYEGKPLSSRQQLYWKVRVWDENKQPTPWSEVATWSMGLNPSDWTARWIAEREDLYPDSTLTFPAPYFRKAFSIDKAVKQAKVYVCGLGFYEMYINGNKVGKQVLAPAVTNYDQRVMQKILYHYDDQSSQRLLYNTFDVTSLLQPGENTAGALLGNGWYNQRDRAVEGCMWYDTPRLLLQLEIEYTDGSRQTIQTDQSWKCTTGPLLHDAIFTGELYDARLELGDWSMNAYDDSGWKPSLEVRAPSGRLQPQLAPFDELTRTLQPLLKEQLNDSVYLYALPEMVSGWAELQVKGAAGDKISLRFIGEEQDDFGQCDSYILKGGGTESWEPRFTWHAFRYIEVSSPQVHLDAKSIRVKVVHTNVRKTGDFSSSNELFNKLYQAYIRTQYANMHGSISSDCPHRERVAYTGDGQVAVESALLSYDMRLFYRKWFDDMEDARNKNTGYVPHTAPFAGGGGGPAWGSAYVIMPWAYYTYYGDIEVLKQHYEGMKHWLQYLATRTDERGLVVREEPNGWCLGDWCTPERVEIPEAYVNTAYYYHCADLMTQIAKALKQEDDAARYAHLCAEIKTHYNKAFFNPETQNYWEGRQGSNVFPLAFGLVAEEHKEAVFQNLLDQLESLDYHFDTGILATPLLLKVLSENGRADIAYQLMDQRSAPGFAYLLDEAYTSLWERWDGRESRCHPMFGSVIAWLYNTLAGIRPQIDKPGMQDVLIAPTPISALSFCKASHQSVYGLIRSEWEQSETHFKLLVEIPPNTKATVYLPNKTEAPILESGKPLSKTDLIRQVETREGLSILEIKSGIYTFETPNEAPNESAQIV